jgi:hypothetical protein
MEAKNGSNDLANMTLEQARDSILDYLRKGNAGHYQIGRRYNHIVTHKLAEKNGYDSTQAFFSQHVKALSQSTLSLYGAVAGEFDEESCVKYGVNKLGILLTYQKATQLPLPEGDPGNMSIAVPQEDGAVQQKPFAECTVEELKQAMKHRRAAAKVPVSTQDEARVQFLRDSLAKYFTEKSRVSVNARVHRDRTLLTVQDIPLAELERLAEAILDAIPPLRAVP